MKTITTMACVSFLLFAFQLYAQPEQKYFCPICNGSCDNIVFEDPGKCPHCNMTLVAGTEAERQKQLSAKPIIVCFYLQDGVEVLDFAGPMEVFSYAGFKVFTVSKTTAPIYAQGILKIIPDYSIDDAPSSDIIAFFGGNTSNGFDEKVIDWLKSRQAATDYFFSVCTGAFALGKAGLLDGKTATTFHLSIDQLASSFNKTRVLSNVRYVDNGTLITTAGISAGIDGALHLVAKLRGDAAAAETAKYMEYDKWVPNDGLIIGDNKPLKK